MLYFTIGCARCGKSTFINDWVKTFGKKLFPDKPIAVVCADNIRLALTGQRFCKEAEQTVQAIKWTMVQSLLDRGNVVMVDGTHTSEQSIEKILSIDPNAVGYFIDTHPDVCKQRAYDTNQPDLVEYGVIDRHCMNIINLSRKSKELFNIKADWIKYHGQCN